MNSAAQTAPSITIVYDGMCHLCDGSMAWIARRVANDRVRFTPVQSVAGAQALKAAGLDELDPASFLVVENGQLLQKSAAVIATLSVIGGIWRSVGRLLKLLPVCFADGIYDWVAANRYKWFGRRETCFIPR